MFTIIAAMSKNRVIGVNNALPWKQSNDLQRFKSITYGKTVFMGRKTFDSIGGVPFPNRGHVIITSKSNKELCELNRNQLNVNVSYYSADVLQWHKSTLDEMFVIGGGQIYELAMPLATKLIITELDCELEGDTYFPEIDLDIWKPITTETYTKDAKNQYDYKFITYVRK